MRTDLERSRAWVGWVLTTFLTLLVSDASAQSGVTWVTNHYAVAGDTVGEIQRAMDRARPWKREHAQTAVTEWNIRSRFAVAAFQGGYRCSGFNTQTSIRITMPQWREPVGASGEVRLEWQRYYEALLAHEVGHGQIALAAAAEMHRQVALLGTEPDAEALKQRVEQLTTQVSEEYRRREVEYDRLTQHGTTQGARLRRGAGQAERGGEKSEQGRAAPGE